MYARSLFLAFFLLAAAAEAQEFSNPFEPTPPNAHAWKVFNPESGHEDGPFALPGTPNPNGYPELALLEVLDGWFEPDACDLFHLHGPLLGHGDPAPEPTAGESGCGHGGLIYLFGPEPITFGGSYCPVTFYEGRLQPSQGVWQDDPIFSDRPGKRITQPEPLMPHYVAELPMVRHRDTLLFGTVRPVGGATVADGRDRIVLGGLATGTEGVAAHIRFTVEQGGAVTWTHDSPQQHSLPIGGSCGPAVPFVAELDAGSGIPASGPPFQWTSQGPYLLRAELILEDGTATGIEATVEGSVDETRDLSVFFLPAVFTAATDVPAVRDALADTAGIIADFSRQRVPQWFPMAEGGLLAEADSTTRFHDHIEEALAETTADFSESFRSRYVTLERGRLVAEFLTQYLTRQAHLAHVDRLVLLAKRQDYNLLDPKGISEGNVGLTRSTKVVFVSEDAVDDEKLVAHEFLHTLPEFKWPMGVDGNDPACDVLYHNQQDPIAHGVNVQERLRMNGVLPILGPDVASPDDFTWITQCSYWHLVNSLDLLVDPPVLLVSGYVLRDAGEIFGAFTPFYQMDGVVSLESGLGGDWAIVLRDGSGAQLDRFPFEPQWQVADQAEERDLVGFAFELPDLPQLAEVELVGPQGLLARRILSPNRPTLAVTLPASDGGLVPTNADGEALVAWTGQDGDGDALRYAALYSSNGGGSWFPRALDVSSSTLAMAVDDAAVAQRVQVLASDGAQAATAEIGFVPATTTWEIFGVAEGGSVEVVLAGETVVVFTAAGQAAADVATSLAAAINANAALAAMGVEAASWGGLAFTNGAGGPLVLDDGGLSLLPDLFADGFESGATTAWSAAVP